MSNSLLEEVKTNIEQIYDYLEQKRQGWTVGEYFPVVGYEFRFVDLGGILDVYYVPANKDEVALILAPFLTKRTGDGYSGLNEENCVKLVTEVVYARLKGYYYCGDCGKAILWDSPISEHKPLCKACYFKNNKNI